MNPPTGTKLTLKQHFKFMILKSNSSNVNKFSKIWYWTDKMYSSKSPHFRFMLFKTQKDQERVNLILLNRILEILGRFRPKWDKIQNLKIPLIKLKLKLIKSLKRGSQNLKIFYKYSRVYLNKSVKWKFKRVSHLKLEVNRFLRNRTKNYN